MSRRLVMVAAALLALLAACSPDDDGAPVSTANRTPSPLASPKAIADDAAGRSVVVWDPVPGREMVVFIGGLCADGACGAADWRLFTADREGTVRELADVDEASSFELTEDGSGVLATIAGAPTVVGLDGPAPQLDARTNTAPLTFDPIPGFEPVDEPIAALDDGRYLVVGRWDEDEPIDIWLQSPGEEERRPGSQRPVRLFIVDPATATVVPISAIPESRLRSTATADVFGPDAVLRAEVLSGGHTVAYEVGFSGAAYDIPYALYLAAVPPSSTAASG